MNKKKLKVSFFLNIFLLFQNSFYTAINHNQSISTDIEATKQTHNNQPEAPAEKMTAYGKALCEKECRYANKLYSLTHEKYTQFLTISLKNLFAQIEKNSKTHSPEFISYLLLRALELLKPGFISNTLKKQFFTYATKLDSNNLIATLKKLFVDFLQGPKQNQGTAELLNLLQQEEILERITLERFAESEDCNSPKAVYTTHIILSLLWSLYIFPDYYTLMHENRNLETPENKEDSYSLCINDKTLFELLLFPMRNEETKKTLQEINMNTTLATLFAPKTDGGYKMLEEEVLGGYLNNATTVNMIIRKQLFIQLLQDNPEEKATIEKLIADIGIIQKKMKQIFGQSNESFKLSKQGRIDQLVAHFQMPNFFGIKSERIPTIFHYLYSTWKQYNSGLFYFGKIYPIYTSAKNMLTKEKNEIEKILDKSFSSFVDNPFFNLIPILPNFFSTSSYIFRLQHHDFNPRKETVAWKTLCQKPFLNQNHNYSKAIEQIVDQHIRSTTRSYPSTIQDFYFQNRYHGDYNPFVASSFALTQSLASAFFSAMSTWEFVNGVVSTVSLWNGLKKYFETLSQLFILCKKLSASIEQLYIKNNIPLYMMDTHVSNGNTIFKNKKHRSFVKKIMNWSGSGVSKVANSFISVIFPAKLTEFYTKEIKNNQILLTIEAFINSVDIAIAKTNRFMLNDTQAPVCMPIILPAQSSFGTIPFFDTHNMWYPAMKNPIGNTLSFGNSKGAKENIDHILTNQHIGYERYNEALNTCTKKENQKKNGVIVGPVASGKTVILATMLTLLYLSRTGISCASSFCFTSFDIILDKIYVPYEIGSGISKHLAELASLQEVISITTANNELAIFAVFDEIYTGTTEGQRKRQSAEDLEKFLTKENIMSIISTHFSDIADYEKDSLYSIILYYIQILFDENHNDIILTRKLLPHDANNFWLSDTKKAEEMRSAYSDFIAKKSPAYTKNINEASQLLFSFLANKKEDNKNQSLCIDAANCIPAEQIEK